MAEVRVTRNLLPELPARAQRTVETALRPVADAFEARARANAPVRTGRLRDSIVADVVGSRLWLRAYAPYAGYVEYGTSRTPPRLFMTRALNEVKPNVGRIMARVLREGWR